MGSTTEELLIQQNNLLQQQIELLKKNNQLLQQRDQILRFNGDSLPAGNEEFVENLHADEMRNGFLVTSQRKKLWNVEIGLINEFARICKKHNLRWFAYYGTMLGAARHRGFIPWDDDVDVIMLRPEYEKFKKIAVEEVKYPYYLDHFYDYRSKDDETTSPDEEQFPLIDRYIGWPFECSFIKLRDSRTTMIEYPKRKNSHQGIFIDIFVFDPVPPFAENIQTSNFNVNGILWWSTFNPQVVQEAIKNNQLENFNIELLQKFLNLTFRQRGLFYEKFTAENFHPSEYVGRIEKNFSMPKIISYKASDFDDVTYLPFEKIEIPVPANYEEHLKISYGDWHQMIFTHIHSKDFSADIPYTEYFRKSFI